MAIQTPGAQHTCYSWTLVVPVSIDYVSIVPCQLRYEALELL